MGRLGSGADLDGLPRERARGAVVQGLRLRLVARTAFVPDARHVVFPITGLALHTHVHLVCRRGRREAPLIAAFLVQARELADPVADQHA